MVAMSEPVTIPFGTDLNEVSESKRHQTCWGEPLPVSNPLLPVLELEEENIPEVLRPWLVDISKRMKCPLDFVAAAAINMISSLIGTRLAIKPKERDDWTIVPNLWGGAIGDPSTLKTPSIAEILKPLNRVIAESQERHDAELQKYEALKVTYDAQKKVYQAQEQDRLKGKNVQSPVCYPEAPRRPTERRFLSNDATIEKLGELLNENTAGLLVFRDELIGLLAGWDRAGREQDRAFYLEAWNGSGSMSVDRIGRGTIHVKHLCLSLFGGIQPAKLNGYLQAATGYDNDGFVQRLQLAVYPDKVPWSYVDDYPDKQARDKAYKIIRDIAEVDFRSKGYLSDEFNQFPYTRFDNEAQSIFVKWLTHWETAVLPNESGLLLEHFAKYRSLMPSLALIFHVLDFSSSPLIEGKKLVSKEAAELAVKWCGYLSSHARRIYGLLDTNHLTAAKELAKHLKKGDLKDEFKLRDVYRKAWTNLQSKELAQAAVDELVERNWLKQVEPESKPLGRPEATVYLINPAIIYRL